jgi:CspA family cold shock protein
MVFYTMSSHDAATESASTVRHIGRVKWFNNQKGYGFLTFETESGKWEDVFVHHSAIAGDDTDSFRYLVQDEYVEFGCISSNDALATASDVTGPLRNKLAYQLRNERRSEVQDQEGNESQRKETRGMGRNRGGGSRQGRLRVGGTEWKIPKRKNTQTTKQEGSENEEEV